KQWLVGTARCQDSFLDPQPPCSVKCGDLGKCITLGLGGARNIDDAARIVEQQFENLAASHLLQAHFRMGPVKRAFNASQIERYSAACGFHRKAIIGHGLGSPESYSLVRKNQPARTNSRYFAAILST